MFFFVVSSGFLLNIQLVKAGGGSGYGQGSYYSQSSYYSQAAYYSQSYYQSTYVVATAVWQGTNWIVDGAVISASKVKSNFDYLYEQVAINASASTNVASSISVEVDYSTCYSAPDLGSGGNTANPWGTMNNTNFACTNNSVLVGMDSGSVSNVVCCKLKIISN